MQTPYSQWWCGSMGGAGLANALDMKLVYRTVSQHQTIELFEHRRLGRVLVLDGVIRNAQHAPVQREMMCHIPLLGHAHDPANVLIIGGASGEILQEVLHHAWIEKVTVIDDDPDLLAIARGRLGYGQAFADPRVELIVLNLQQALALVRNNQRRYDVIFDTLDPAGRAAAEVLKTEFYDDLAALLEPDGVAVNWRRVVLGAQAPRAFSPRPPVIYPFDTLLAKHFFTAAQCYQVLDPLQAGGMSAFFLYRKKDISYDNPRAAYQGLHYNENIHRHAFALPTWWRQNLQDIRTGRNLDTPARFPAWFEHTYGSGLSQALSMRRVYHKESEFQEIEYYQHDFFGRVFVLDGTVQGSHADEFIYHEMAVHVPLLGRRRSQVRALVIGGGDGGIVRELLKHDFVSRIVMVEIDREVVASSNRYFAIQGNYDDPRVELIIGDAADYVMQAQDAAFELIIVDATDSTTPSESLWNDAFFSALARCLSADGVCLDSDIWIAGEHAYLSRDTANRGLPAIRRGKRFFPHLQCFYTRVPLFPGGNFVFFLYSKDRFSYAAPCSSYSGIHYNPELHKAAFALPSQWRAVLDDL